MHHHQWAGPTLKRVKPLLEAPINFKKSTVKQGSELEKIKIKATKIQFRGISGKEKEKKKKCSQIFLSRSAPLCLRLLLSSPQLLGSTDQCFSFSTFVSFFFFFFFFFISLSLLTF
jgi:hypothetical protein